ncbi:MAG: RloB family protein [Euryarchaeota archaeon]|nr:RloB family protein [Euryarchaeota archaeon]
MTLRHSRRTSVRRPRKRLFVICEGERTERLYFLDLRKNFRMNIEVKPSHDRDAIGMVRCCLKVIEDEELDLEDGDEVWCVFDTDNNTDEMIEEATRIAGPVNIAISNPCFELWFILHFEYHDKRINDCEEAVKVLTKHIHDYCKSKDVFPMIEGSTADAIENAKKLNKHHLGQGKVLKNCECNPSTQVFLLLERFDELRKRS